MTIDHQAVVIVSAGVTMTKPLSEVRKGERFWPANAQGTPMRRDPLLAINDAHLFEGDDENIAVWAVEATRGV